MKVITPYTKITGDDKGKDGIINYVVQERNWVCVEGLNLEYISLGADKDFPGMMQVKEKPLDVTKDIKLIDPSDEKVNRLSCRVGAGALFENFINKSVELPVHYNI